ncbi:NUDIX hydrolase [Bacillus sp. UNCCL13]|nr:NUDIX hydrolase [Bacillus sp. UNCCL13]
MMKRVDVVYAFIQNENDEILVVQNHRENGYDFTLPGGAVEAGETLTEALIREVKEETGFEVVPRELLSINEAFFQKSGHHTIFFTFSARVTGGKIEILFPDEIAEVRWMSPEEADLKVKNFGDGLKTYFTNQSSPYFFRGQM